VTASEITRYRMLVLTSWDRGMDDAEPTHNATLENER
jgi:ferritin-like metal-binding protein YciE